MVQVAWLLTDGEGGVLDEQVHVIHPEDFSIPPEASRIHGITEAYAMDVGVPLPKVIEDLNGSIGESECLVAHNIAFDEKVVGAEFHRRGVSSSLFEKERICTMKGSTEFCQLPGRRGYKWPKLSELHIKLFGEAFDGAHGALEDTRALKDCFFELRGRGVL